MDHLDPWQFVRQWLAFAALPGRDGAHCVDGFLVGVFRLVEQRQLHWLNLFNKPIWIVARSATLSSW